MNERANKILKFWFVESNHEYWFRKNDNFDKKIRDFFWEDYIKAINNEYDEWQDSSESCVALIIILDQFSRNLFRDNPKAFAQDYKSRLIVNEAVDRGYLEELDLEKVHFLLLPLMHSEDISDHIFGHKLVEAYLKNHTDYDLIKKAWNDHTLPIKKFGRYPHRNKVLNRNLTEKEKEFLQEPNSSW